MEGKIEKFLKHKPEGEFVFMNKSNIRYLIGDYVEGSALIVGDDYEFVIPEMNREVADLFPSSVTGNPLSRIREGSVFEPDAPAHVVKKFKGNLDDTILRMRMVKDRDEIDALLSAQQKSANLLLRVADIVAESSGEMSEKDIMAYVYSYAIEHDLEFSFNPIIAFDSSASMPHHVAGDKKADMLALIDIGVKSSGYCGDITRVVLLKKPDRIVEHAMELVEKAYHSASERYAESTLQDVEAPAKDILGSNLIHSIGHGIGLDVHEKPGKADMLSENTVFTIEPGYYEYGLFGLRIEDMFIGKRGKVNVIDDLWLEMY